MEYLQPCIVPGPHLKRYAFMWGHRFPCTSGHRRRRASSRQAAARVGGCTRACAFLSRICRRWGRPSSTAGRLSHVWHCCSWSRRRARRQGLIYLDIGFRAMTYNLDITQYWRKLAEVQHPSQSFPKRAAQTSAYLRDQTVWKLNFYEAELY